MSASETKPVDTTVDVTLPPGVLIVDDIRSIVATISVIVERDGCVAYAASGLEEAARYLEDEKTLQTLRMVFLDIELGAHLGFDVYKIIRAKNCYLPVVFMSGGSYNKLLFPILADDHCASFMAKPFDVATIRLLLRSPLAWGGDVSKLLHGTQQRDAFV
jgi:DNA-binding NtrC family response regulator